MVPNCPGLGANAFALPGGTIVFTDGIVTLSEGDRELQGVFAHELGHLERRHTMRHVLQDSATSMLLILITGDVHSASSLAAAIPTILVQTKFSRAFEHEADVYAVNLMKRRGIPPRFLADLLKRLDAVNGGDMPGFLSTHPVAAERVRALSESRYADEFGRDIAMDKISVTSSAAAVYQSGAFQFRDWRLDLGWHETVLVSPIVSQESSVLPQNAPYGTANQVGGGAIDPIIRKEEKQVLSQV